MTIETLLTKENCILLPGSDILDIEQQRVGILDIVFIVALSINVFARMDR